MKKQARKTVSKKVAKVAKVASKKVARRPAVAAARRQKPASRAA